MKCTFNILKYCLIMGFIILVSTPFLKASSFAAKSANEKLKVASYSICDSKQSLFLTKKPTNKNHVYAEQEFILFQRTNDKTIKQVAGPWLGNAGIISDDGSYIYISSIEDRQNIGRLYRRNESFSKFFYGNYSLYHTFDDIHNGYHDQFSQNGEHIAIQRYKNKQSVFDIYKTTNLKKALGSTVALVLQFKQNNKYMLTLKFVSFPHHGCTGCAHPALELQVYNLNDLSTSACTITLKLNYDTQAVLNSLKVENDQMSFARSLRYGVPHKPDKREADLELTFKANHQATSTPFTEEIETISLIKANADQKNTQSGSSSSSSSSASASSSSSSSSSTPTVAKKEGSSTSAAAATTTVASAAAQAAHAANAVQQQANAHIPASSSSASAGGAPGTPTFK